MRLDDLRENWEGYGETNPLWAVHTGIDPNQVDEAGFFKTGESDIDRVLSMVDDLGVAPQKGRALDFGCGVGRLSLALARRFDQVDGVDISEPMLRRANEFRSADEDIDDDSVRFHLNTELDLSIFEDRTFSFVLSLITLQHMRPEFAARYIKEFCRVTGVGGVLVFQIPSRRTTALLRLRGRVGRSARRLRASVARNGSPVMEMYGTPRARVERLIEESGLRIVAVLPDDHAASWESYTYVAIRDEAG